jgi:hypothetical protein
MIGRRSGLIRGQRCDHGVDDQFAEIGDACGHQAGRQRQQRQPDGQAAMRRPDESNRPAALTPEAQVAVDGGFGNCARAADAPGRMLWALFIRMPTHSCCQANSRLNLTPALP